VNQLTTPRLSLRDDAILMMLISDNTSANVLIDTLGLALARRPYIFVAMCTYLKTDDDGDAAIGETSRAVFDYFNRLGAEGAFGRVIR
jgi:beta-lactamase class A